MRSDGVIHLLLHCLAGSMEGIKGLAGIRLPVGGEVERHLPFLQRIAGVEVERLALAPTFADLERRA